MSRVGLSRFGIVAPTPIRQPATDADGLKICPGCGRPVGKTKGSHLVERPTILSDQEADELVTFGWACDRHTERVVLPDACHGPDAPTMPDGWIGVRVEFADGSARHIPVPAREVRE